ncbi:MAG: Na(+)/H(+) antiporter subunit B [Gaiellaceae bacterium]
MIPLQVVSIVLVGAGALAVVLQRDPLRQAIVNSVYALLLVVLFMIYQAPDVALSMLVVGSIAYPLVLMVAIMRVRDRGEETTDRTGR